MNTHKILKGGLICIYSLLVLVIMLAGAAAFGLLAGGVISGVSVAAAVLGVRSTANTESTIHVRNVDNIMPYIWRNQAPINQFFMAKDLRQEMTDGLDSAFEHFEKDQRANTTTVAAGITGGSNTEVLVVGEEIFRKNDTVTIDATGDVCDVSAVSGTSITLRRVGGGNITAGTAGVTIRRLATAFSDNYVAQTAYSNNATGKTGYCQIMLEAIQMTGREQAAKKYGGNEDWSKILEETLANLAYDQDNSWIYNTAAVKETLSDGVRTHSVGLMGGITTNVGEYAGSLSMDEVDDHLESFTTRGVKGYANEWICWAGTGYIRQLNAALKAERNWVQSDADKKDAIIRIYGGLHKGGADPEILKYNAEFATIYYMWNPNLVGRFKNIAVYVHPQCMKMRYMNNDEDGPRKYRVEKNVKTPGAGNKHDQILTDTGLHIMTEKLMSWHHQA